MELDTIGDEGVDHLIVVRSDGRELIATLYRVREDGSERAIGTVDAGRDGASGAAVSVALRRLAIGPDRTSYRWSVTTSFVGRACPQTCLDHVPDEGMIEQLLPGVTPSPTPSPHARRRARRRLRRRARASASSGRPPPAASALGFPTIARPCDDPAMSGGNGEILEAREGARGRRPRAGAGRRAHRGRRGPGRRALAPPAPRADPAALHRAARVRRRVDLPRGRGGGRVPQGGGHRGRVPVGPGLPADRGGHRGGRRPPGPRDLRRLRQRPGRPRPSRGPGLAPRRHRRPDLVARRDRRLLRGVLARSGARLRSGGRRAARPVRQARRDRDHERPPPRGLGGDGSRGGHGRRAQPDGPRGARHRRAGPGLRPAPAPGRQRGPGRRAIRRGRLRARRRAGRGRGGVRGDAAERARPGPVAARGPLARGGARARGRVGQPDGRRRPATRHGRHAGGAAGRPRAHPVPHRAGGADQRACGTRGRGPCGSGSSTAPRT